MKHNYRLASFVLAGALTGVSGLLSSSAGAAEDFPGIKALMSVEEFEKTGLNRLSTGEIKALDEWLIRYTAGDAQFLVQSNETVKKAEKEYEVESRIVGDFTGWDGETYFRLENGQLWQQRLDGRYNYRGPANPRVRISRNWLGMYRLTLIDEDRSVGVSLRDSQ